MARKKGSRNRGYWYRTGRGWYADDSPLLDAEGKHIRGKEDRQAAEQAYHLLKANGEALASEEEAPAAPAGFTVADVCREYLNDAKAHSSRETLVLRTRFLLDFCNGTTKSGRRVHKGYGNLPADQLIGLHVKQWLDAHKWAGSRRMAYQAVRRAFHYGQELGMIPAGNTLRYKVGSVRKRKAYFDSATEETMYATANHAASRRNPGLDPNGLPTGRSSPT